MTSYGFKIASEGGTPTAQISVFPAFAKLH